MSLAPHPGRFAAHAGLEKLNSAPPGLEMALSSRAGRSACGEREGKAADKNITTVRASGCFRAAGADD